MVKYPHILSFTLTSEGSFGTSGDFIQSLDSETIETNCRLEGNPSGSFISLVNGDQYVYTGIIYFPLEAPTVPTGVMLEVQDSSGNIILKGICKAFQRYQKGVIAWV